MYYSDYLRATNPVGQTSQMIVVGTVDGVPVNRQDHKRIVVLLDR